MYNDNLFVLFATQLGMNIVSVIKNITDFFVMFFFYPVKKLIKFIFVKIKKFGFRPNKGKCIAFLLSVCIILSVISFFDDYTFALEVKCNDEITGYVQNEADVEDSVRNADSVLSIANEKSENVTYRRVFIKSDRIDDTESIANKIINLTDSSFKYCCGIYIDDKFICAVDNQADAYEVFDSLLSEYKSEEKNTVFAFNSDINCVYGLYPSNSSVLWDKSELLSYLKINPLKVKMQKMNTYEVSVDYNTVNINSDAIYQGNSTVLQEGQNGTQRVTDVITYVDGIQVAKSELSRITLKSAVSKRVAIGTRIASVVKYTKSFGGVMLWPAPQNCYYLSSYYGYRWGSLHGGIDIISSDGTSCRGRPIVAAASGKVIAAQYHWSWGNYIKIDHGNGIATLYAHMMDNSFCVNVGDYVTAGQQIGSIGTTGNSTGYHLHFEVYINGTRVDPLPFVYSEQVQYYD